MRLHFRRPVPSVHADSQLPFEPRGKSSVLVVSSFSFCLSSRALRFRSIGFLSSSLVNIRMIPSLPPAISNAVMMLPMNRPHPLAGGGFPNAFRMS